MKAIVPLDRSIFDQHNIYNQPFCIETPDPSYLWGELIFANERQRIDSDIRIHQIAFRTVGHEVTINEKLEHLIRIEILISKSQCGSILEQVLEIAPDKCIFRPRLLGSPENIEIQTIDAILTDPEFTAKHFNFR